MQRWLSGRAALAICGLLLCSLTWAQSDDQPVPLGDLARWLRKKDQSSASHTIIDNDNISQITDEVESQRLTRSSLLYTFDATGKTFYLEFCTVAHWKNGEIVEENLFYDQVGFLKQIGVL